MMSLKFKPTMVRNTHAAVQAYNRGTLYQQQEDWDRAIYYYTRAVENDDTFATAFFNLGAVYWSRGEFDYEGMETMLKGLQLVKAIEPGPFDWKKVVDESFLPDDLRSKR